MKERIVVVAGPTAVGKTDISIELAKRLNGEIISADSMQVYRHMDIGTAKVTEEEMSGIKHYLIDILEPDERFDVSIFKNMAKDAVTEITAKGKLPIIVGGTGFYIQALLKDVDFENEEKNAEDVNSRKYYEYARVNGNEALHKELEKIDKASADSIHYNNVKRVIRALEFYDNTGKLFSEYNAEQKERISPYDYKYFVLNDDREKLYERINQRIDKMLDMGLLSEVKKIYDLKLPTNATSLQGIGYKEYFDYFRNEKTVDECTEILKQETRRFAKRQLTWFRRENDTIWKDWQTYGYDKEKLLESIISDINSEWKE